MIRLTIILALATLVLLACSAPPTSTPPALRELPRIEADDVTDWQKAMELAGILRDRAAELARLVETCDYEPQAAQHYIPCCSTFLHEALTETSTGYAAILEYGALATMVYEEVYEQPMTAEQQEEFIDYWTYTITSLQNVLQPTERMLRDFGCLQ